MGPAYPNIRRWSEAMKTRASLAYYCAAGVFLARGLLDFCQNGPHWREAHGLVFFAVFCNWLGFIVARWIVLTPAPNWLINRGFLRACMRIVVAVLAVCILPACLQYVLSAFPSGFFLQKSGGANLATVIATQFFFSLLFSLFFSGVERFVPAVWFVGALCPIVPWLIYI